MSVGIVLVTHGHIGDELVGMAEFILGESLHGVRVVPFRQSGTRQTSGEELAAALSEADRGEGLLVLADLLGASPANTVFEQLESRRAVLVTGLNLAMLISVWNYRGLSLEALARKAVESGRRGVKIFQP